MSDKIALLVIATGRYDRFVAPLLESADKWFLLGREVEYVVFTDKEVSPPSWISRIRAVIPVGVDHLPWPLATLLRYHRFTAAREHLAKYSHLFYVDADMLFQNTVGDEILSDGLTVTQHPGFYGKTRDLPFERNPQSHAYLHYPALGTPYICGGMNGGKASVFLDMSEFIANQITDDLKRHVIARWHDESYLNAYIWGARPGKVPLKVLTPEYCWSANHPHKALTPRLIALDKNHDEVRQ